MLQVNRAVAFGTNTYAKTIVLFWYIEHCKFQQLDLAAVSGIVGGGQVNREHIFPACYEVIKLWGYDVHTSYK